MTVVRRAVPSDGAALRGLIAEFYVADQHPYDEDVVMRGLAPLLTDDTYGQVWVVSAGGASDEPEGYAVVTWGWSLEAGGRECILDELFVRRQGHGIGRVLVHHALVEAEKAGASRMFLETEAHNSRVRGFYGELGFAVEDSVWMNREFFA